jgi:hypothetical protein
MKMGQKCGKVLMKMNKEWEFWWTYLMDYREGKLRVRNGKWL